jgi:hypothetical protein
LSLADDQIEVGYFKQIFHLDSLGLFAAVGAQAHDLDGLPDGLKP